MRCQHCTARQSTSLRVPGRGMQGQCAQCTHAEQRWRCLPGGSGGSSRTLTATWMSHLTLRVRPRCPAAALRVKNALALSSRKMTVVVGYFEDRGGKRAGVKQVAILSTARETAVHGAHRQDRPPCHHGPAQGGHRRPAAGWHRAVSSPTIAERAAGGCLFPSAAVLAAVVLHARD